MNNYRRNTISKQSETENQFSFVLFLLLGFPQTSSEISLTLFNFKVLKYFIGIIVLNIKLQRNSHSHRTA